MSAAEDVQLLALDVPVRECERLARVEVVDTADGESTAARDATHRWQPVIASLAQLDGRTAAIIASRGGPAAASHHQAGGAAEPAHLRLQIRLPRRKLGPYGLHVARTRIERMHRPPRVERSIPARKRAIVGARVEQAAFTQQPVAQQRANHRIEQQLGRGNWAIARAGNPLADTALVNVAGMAQLRAQSLVVIAARDHGHRSVARRRKQP